jgi:DNA modification methylase
MAKNSKQPGLTYGQNDTTAQGPVECLGQTFPNDEARRAHFTDLLGKKLKDQAFRKLDGFPLGNDEDILALSDPPYYTACPNPFLEDFVRHYGRQYDSRSDSYSKQPFTADVTEGKNDPIYDAHSYHTKVPHKAIMRYILHYTSPGDVVFDGFCGTGMTGVAAQLCGDKQEVSSLRYSVTANGEISGSGDGSLSSIGVRNAIVSDIAPIATFIASNLLRACNPDRFATEAALILNDVKDDLKWLYKTTHNKSVGAGDIVYTVWSDVFLCPECGGEIDAWQAVVDVKGAEMRKSFPCTHCSASLLRRNLDKAMMTQIDLVTGKPHKLPKQNMSLIHYKVGKKRFVKTPDQDDLKTVARAIEVIGKYDLPTCSFESTWQHVRDGNHIKNITHSHHYYTVRNSLALAALRKRLEDSPLRNEMLFVLTGFIEGHASKRNRYIIDRHHTNGTTCGPLSNTLFVPEIQCEVNVFDKWEQTVKKQLKAKLKAMPRHSIVQARSATGTGIPDNSVDYIFVDPPFGANIIYSELNLLYESWLKVFTESRKEAVVNDRWKKGISEYGNLMAECFSECFRILKPCRWMTVEFHNSWNAVWAAIQEALTRAGFVVADVRVLDKKHGTIRQDAGTAVKKDLIVSVYKPKSSLEDSAKVLAGSEESAWHFVSSHLEQLPLFVAADGQGEVIAERQRHMLYDRMVAFHVQRGHSVPLSASEFYSGLTRKYSERDGMVFLHEQTQEYDRYRASIKRVEQLQLFVNDEKSAIQWVRQQLSQGPTTYQDLQPQFMKEAQRVWEKHELPLELQTILDQNFVMEKDGKWHIADPKNEVHLEQLRHRALMKEFQQYLDSKGKLKVVRTEALRAGFKESWQKKDYTTIVQMAKRVPDAVIQEDPALLMYFDNASLLKGE